MVSFAVGLGPVSWFITNEIYPAEYLNAGNVIAVSMNWIFAFLIVSIFDVMYKMFEDKFFFVFFTSMILMFVYILFCFKETKGREPDFQ